MISDKEMEQLREIIHDADLVSPERTVTRLLAARQAGLFSELFVVYEMWKKRGRKRGA